MTIFETIELAVKGGWKMPNHKDIQRICGEGYLNSTFYSYVLDPLFWQALFGNEKYGRMKAKELIEALFNGKTIEQFFEQMAKVGEK